MTNVIPGSIRNRTGRLENRSQIPVGMKAVKEDDDNSGGGGQTGKSSVHENNEVEILSPPLPGEDSSSSMDEQSQEKNKQPPQPPPLPPLQRPHRHHHHHPENNHRNNNVAINAQAWGKNIEEGINGILKRLDELSAGQNEPPPKKNGLIPPRAGLLNNPVHRDITSERLHYAKERERLKQRIDELEKANEKLTNEIRQWKSRHDELTAENRHLMLLKHSNDEIKKSSVVLTDIKGRPSVVRIDQLTDQNGKSEAGWLSLWNVLPHVGPLVPLPNGKSDVGPFPPSDPESLIRCLQINLQHKKKAMERTKRLLIDRNIDIALIQEPYAIGPGNPELMGVPAGYTAYHNLTEHHPHGAAVIAKNSLRARICSFGRNDIAGIQLRLGNKTYHFYSVFCRPSALNLSATLLPLLDQAPPTLVIGMDASAKHPKWNNGMVYRKIDQRGRELERLLDQYDMHLASPPLYKLKYIPENYSFIDVTLGGENIQFHDWKFWEDSICDHPYIFFQVE